MTDQEGTSSERPPLPDGVGGFEPGHAAEDRIPEHIRKAIPRPSLNPSTEEISALLESLKGTGYVLVPISHQVRADLDDAASRFHADDFSDTIAELIAFWKRQSGLA
jgi:hypothetical protein